MKNPRSDARPAAVARRRRNRLATEAFPTSPFEAQVGEPVTDSIDDLKNSSASPNPDGNTVPPSSRGPGRWFLGSLLAVIGAAVVGTALWIALRPEPSHLNPVLPVWTARIKNTFPHNPGSFTQGLSFKNEQLYEGTGGYGPSRMLVTELTTGRVVLSQALDSSYFGEGIELLGDKVYQLTWKERVGLIYDQATLRPEGSFRLPGEAWGLTTDGRLLIMSDGSNRLQFLDPKQDFKVVQTVNVQSEGRPVMKLNELEWVDGEIWANVWYQDYLVRIDPKTGAVIGYVDLRGIRPASTRGNTDAVLNGIAFDPATKRVFVTGKLWPKVFEIETVAPRR